MNPTHKLLSTRGIALVTVINLVVILSANGSADEICRLMEVNGDSKKLVCVCDEQQCSKLTFDWPQEPGQARLVQSSQLGLRFFQSPLRESVEELAPVDRVHVDLEDRHQRILGWGGAFTDAAGINIVSLSEKLADLLIDGYYGPDGLQYNFGRVPIAGADFSTRPYSYDDTNEPDYNLTHWALAPDDTEYKIPYIKKAVLAAHKAGHYLKLFASPWSPPAWMKTSKSFIKGRLSDEDRVYRSYAEYLMKFYDAYLKHGIRFWGATVQNEPILPIHYNYTFNSLAMDARDTIKFVGRYLGPALRQRGYTKQNFKLMVGDDSLGLINGQVPDILHDERVREFVSGLAFHWYNSGRTVPFSALDEVYEAIKDKVEFVLMTEACQGAWPDQRKKVDLGSWERGESYATDIIEDLHRHTAGWIDWNLALDYRGGPNWVDNFVDSPVIVNKHRGEFYQQPMYHVLAHFSRFFRPGAVRVGSELRASDSAGSPSEKELMAVAVHNEETGHLVVNVLNKSEREKKVEISIKGRPAKHTASISGRSINSIVVKL